MEANNSTQPFNLLQPLVTRPITPEQIYQHISETGITRMVAAFYRHVPNDEILSPMYPTDELEESEARLRDFLIFRFGGPQRYIEQRGHPRLRMRHATFVINQAARDRWAELMRQAVITSGFPKAITAALHEFFDEVATFLINRP